MHFEWETNLICIYGLLLFSVQKFQSILYKVWTLYIRSKYTPTAFKHLNTTALPLMGCKSVSWYAEIVHGVDKARVGLTHRQAKQNFMIAGVFKSLICNLRLADDTIIAWVIQKSETMALSTVYFITNLTVCHPHDLKDGERDSRNSATSADKSRGGEGTVNLTQSLADTFSNMTELYTQDTGCLSHWIRKWHLLLLLWWTTTQRKNQMAERQQRRTTRV